jgi:putative ABC transport system permease protein
MLGLVTIATALLAGVYPAFVLSGFRPVTVLRGSFSSSSQGALLRRALVVFQFAISIALLVGTGVVSKQLHYIRTQDLGFDAEQVVVLPLESEQGVENVESFIDDIEGHPSIVNAAAASSIPGPDHVHQTTVFHGELQSPEDVFLAVLTEVTYDYVKTLGLKIVAGRDFSRDHPSDASDFLISEAAVREMGLSPEEAVGKSLSQVAGNEDDSDRIGTIVGVFRDAHFESFHEAMLPVVVGMRTGRRYIPVRIAAAQTEEALTFLKEKWMAFEPGYPFRYFFMDDDFSQYYQQDARLGTIYAWFTGLALMIACLGLFGLASFVTVQRTREIGVRKVLGATVPSIVFLLTREFTRLVLVACVIAFPVAWYAMKSWLQNFAYATDMAWWIFVLAGLTAVMIAWLTVSYQSIRAAVANPVASLHQS